MGLQSVNKEAPNLRVSFQIIGGKQKSMVVKAQFHILALPLSSGVTLVSLSLSFL